MKKTIFMLSTLLVISMASCDKISKKDLEVAKEKWENLGATKYAFDYNVSCFCGGLEHFPARLIVENNAITGVKDINTGADKTYDNGTLVADSLPELAYTIGRLFEVLEEARADADDLQVSFDNANGYPTEISIDWITNAVDDEVSYMVSNFEEL